MLKSIRATRLGTHDEDAIWSVRCNHHQIEKLIRDPVEWVKQMNRHLPHAHITLADLKKHPDITISFNYNVVDDNATGEKEGYVVEGVGCTNIISVRAPRTVAGPRAASVLSNERQKFLDTTGEMKISIRAADRLAYYHFELSHDPANKEATISNVLLAIFHPHTFLDYLNGKSENGQVQTTLAVEADAGAALAANTFSNTIPIRFDTLEGPRVAAAALGATGGAGLDRFRLNYQWGSQITTCACCKGTSVAMPDGHGGYIIVTDTVNYYCYACPG